MGIIIDEFTPQELAAERARRQPREGGRFVKREAEPEANPRQDAADAAFMARHTDDGTEQPPEAQAATVQGDPDTSSEDATKGAVAGFVIGGPVGAAVGAGAAFLASKASQQRPIGAPLKGGVSTEGNSDLADLLAVTKQIARAGTPIKNAVVTKALGSRM